jgi:hypothetical protein
MQRGKAMLNLFPNTAEGDISVSTGRAQDNHKTAFFRNAPQFKNSIVNGNRNLIPVVVPAQINKKPLEIKGFYIIFKFFLIHCRTMPMEKMIFGSLNVCTELSNQFRPDCQAEQYLAIKS